MFKFAAVLLLLSWDVHYGKTSPFFGMRHNLAIQLGGLSIVVREEDGASRIASPFKLSFTMRSGTSRVRHRKMAEFALARSGIDAKPQVKPTDRRAEPPIMERAWRASEKILAGAFLSLYAPLQSRQKSLNRSGLSSV
jgi:hypothetical protein